MSHETRLPLNSRPTNSIDIYIKHKQNRNVQTGGDCRQWKKYVYTAKLQCVTFIFVTGHVVVKDNEGADSLESKVTMAGDKEMDETDTQEYLQGY